MFRILRCPNTVNLEVIAGWRKALTRDIRTDVQTQYLHHKVTYVLICYLSKSLSDSAQMHSPYDTQPWVSRKPHIWP